MSLVHPLVLFGQTFRLIEDLSIKNEHFSFSKVNLNVCVSSNGQIFVANNNSIWLYSKSGELIKKISRSGRGPGEFLHLGNIFLNGEDILYGIDGSLAKIEIFSPPTYKTTKQIIIQPTSGYNAQEIFVFSPNQFLVTYHSYVTINQPKQSKNLLLLLNGRGTIADTVLKFKSNQMFIHTNGNHITTLNVPFGFKTLLKLGDDKKVYLGKTNEKFIQIFNENGAFIRKIKIDPNPILVPEKVMDLFKSRAKSNKPGSQIFQMLLEANVIPKVKPLYDSFLIDDNGRIWITLNTENKLIDLVTIIGESGKTIVKTELPYNITLKEVRDGFAYAIRENKQGEQAIIRYQVKLK